MRSGEKLSFLSRFYPEVRAGGFTSIDGTIEFYSRVNSLLVEDMVALDFGAGRAAWYEDDECEYRKRLRTLKGKVRRLIACDMDSAVLTNRSADEVQLLHPDVELPFLPESIDIVVADYVFEHVANPDWLANELHRVLKPGGWICARTPAKYSYPAIATRILPNRSHQQALRMIQPGRKPEDVFPTAYKLNTSTALHKAFPIQIFDQCIYFHSAEPAYHFNNAIIFQTMRVLNWLLPKPLHCNIFAFLRKRVNEHH